MLNKALFLDRDGVINEDLRYVHNKDEFIFTKGIFKLCRNAIQKGYLIIIITNQSGIGRMMYSLKDFKRLSFWMVREFSKQKICISDIFYCPHHPVFGIGRYKKQSFLRKPSPGMILDAKQKHHIDLRASLLVGDRKDDIECGKKMGLKKLFFFNQNEKAPSESISISHLSEVIAYL